ncbi:MAG TPA: hypothetical protein VMF69_21090 [Gemmataceae bacterium]|nr:hypothetical protein [Gemmataceae bacterium]
MWARWPLLLGCCCVFLSGCWDNDKTSAPTAANASVVTLPFHARLLDIAATYPEFGRVDAPMRLAPGLCEAASTAPPAAVRASASKDKQTHGRKLYSIFAKIHANGLYGGEVGQIVVKESWLPEEIADNGQFLQAVSHKVKVPAKEAKDSTKTVEIDDYYVPYVRKDGHLYHAAKRGPLFIMFKMDPKTPNTDEGWVYGTVTADGKEVTSAGRVESCMSCHRKAPQRLFGLPKE